MDEWATWLLRRRDGGDEHIRQYFAPQLLAFRDGVLDRARIATGDTVLDVGTGTGLLALGALDRVGGTGRVVFSDISDDLLRQCAASTGGDPRCSFVRAAADDLGAVPDASVDVVVTRSVLIYVDDKAAAFAEFRRVLRPGGRLSVFEPINSFPGTPTLLGLDPGPVAALAERVRGAYPRIPAMTGFDERDLLRAVRDAGFTAVAMDYRAEVDVPGPPIGDWQALKNTAPNPLAPTWAEAMAAVLTPAELARLDAYGERAVTEAWPTRRTAASVYLSAESP
ncbi:methyltransferase domain-containing protein [Actinoplanes sp. N902-109]|uniref:methyltransferase domain-containing protein n=1 Tax=Actinoplanes sp. (strain N902-109) TaxID=649831 RepID=UPI0003296094|nr:methyltransferase domain-containing protein [Actinoplanes sp. N902-109]AGL18757.1 MCP methyltransferase, CheR-type [Actinoplanes sp. N902-109]